MGCCGSTEAVQEAEERQRLLESKAGSKSIKTSVGDRIQNNFCFKCGGKLHPGSRFCPGCGAVIPVDDKQAQVDSEEEDKPTPDQLKREWQKREEEDRQAKERKEAEEEERKRRQESQKATLESKKESWKEKEIRLQKERVEAEKQRTERSEQYTKKQEKKKRKQVQEANNLRKWKTEERLKAGGVPLLKSQSAIFSKDAKEKRTVSILGESEEVFRKRQNLERQESQQQLYGMDLELHKKAMQKLEGEEERIEQAMEWIEKVTGIQKIGEFPDCLKSGKMLCALANVLRPGIIDKVNERPITLLERENIQSYLVACDKMGINKQDLFGISDLYEEKYLPAVLQNIYAVAAKASQSKNFKGPVLKVYS